MTIYFRNKHNGVVSKVRNKSELIRFVEIHSYNDSQQPFFNETIDKILSHVSTNDYFIMKGAKTK